MIDIIKYLLAKKKGAQKNIALLYSMGVIPTMAKLEPPTPEPPTDLKDTKWLMNSTITEFTYPDNYEMNVSGFVSASNNNTNYSFEFYIIRKSLTYKDFITIEHQYKQPTVNFYPQYGWYYRNTRISPDRYIVEKVILTIKSGSTTREDYIEWLMNNATQIIDN